MEDFSLIILCRGHRHLLPLTLDTLKPQSGAFEVILVDPEGEDRLSEVTSLYPELKIKRAEAIGQSLPAMMNQGLHLASGAYVQFLQPGDRYLSHHGLAFLTELIGQKPPLITARGISPEAQSHWLRRDTLIELGGFDEKLSYRPLMDVLFRLQNRGEKPVLCRRAIVDEPHPATSSFTETCKILYRHFGLWHTLKWVFRQDRRQLLQRAAAFAKQAFWGKD